MATNLVTTGPPIMTLRWGQETNERDGATERTFLPATAYAEPQGYLHPGVLAAGILDAARLGAGLPRSVASLSVAVDRLVPVGDELYTAVSADSDDVNVEIRRRTDATTEDEPVMVLATGLVRAGRSELPPRFASMRALADVPLPAAEDEPSGDTDLHTTCWLCGDNPQGLGLRPGWHGPDSVITSFLADEDTSEDGAFSPAVTAAVLSCPTLWPNRERLEDRDARGAVLASYDVTYLEDVPPRATLRTVGVAGDADDEYVRGASALLSENGTIHATAQASWRIVSAPPAREPGRAPSAGRDTPLRGGRPEAHSPEGTGRPLPGRRESPGPRSERPSDHDARASQDLRGVPAPATIAAPRITEIP